jgi:hypothetical protein
MDYCKLMPLPLFTVTGTNKDDLWHVDGTPHFSVMPANISRAIGSDTSIPIWLKVGTPAFGEKHILGRHGHWVERHNMTVPELVHFKLGHSGNVYCTEKNSKIKVTLPITPSALLVLDLITHTNQPPHFSVTTLYHHQGPLDGKIIGRYKGRPKIM